ncbi:MAG: hypothetical protein ACREKB_06440, partial [Candidatus Rokuibacteriota bacterium]
VAAVSISAGLVLAACHPESARSASAARPVSGAYSFAAAGETFSLPWAFQGELILRDSARYELTVSVNVKDEHEQKTDSGTYRVEGDRLLLVTGDPEREPYRLRIRGDSLLAELQGWGTERLLKAVGVPRPVFVRQR